MYKVVLTHLGVNTRKSKLKFWARVLVFIFLSQPQHVFSVLQKQRNWPCCSNTLRGQYIPLSQMYFYLANNLHNNNFICEAFFPCSKCWAAAQEQHCYVLKIVRTKQGNLFVCVCVSPHRPLVWPGRLLQRLFPHDPSDQDEPGETREGGGGTSIRRTRQRRVSAPQPLHLLHVPNLCQSGHLPKPNLCQSGHLPKPNLCQSGHRQNLCQCSHPKPEMLPDTDLLDQTPLNHLKLLKLCCKAQEDLCYENPSWFPPWFPPFPGLPTC